jgi:hypothetical protein
LLDSAGVGKHSDRQSTIRKAEEELLASMELLAAPAPSS